MVIMREYANKRGNVGIYNMPEIGIPLSELRFLTDGKGHLYAYQG